jgi:Fe-S cluster biosynthesis and repair protein YggX
LTDLIHCLYLKQTLPAMSRAPFSGELGARLLAEISQPAWEAWLARQTMLINENRLSPVDPKSRAYLKEQLQAFFYGDGAEAPAGYVAPESTPPASAG